MIPAVIVLWCVWMSMTRSLALPVLLAGGASAVIVVAFWACFMPRPSASIKRLYVRPIGTIRYAITLLARFIVSTLATSWLILRGNEHGRLMVLPLNVSDPIARFILLNSITLTPSTISLLVEDDLLYIHWLRADADHQDWRTIKDALEVRLKSIFEEAKRDRV